jgi:Zn-dependent protease with chaperone function
VRLSSAIACLLLACSSLPALAVDMEEVFAQSQLRRVHDVSGQAVTDSPKATIVRATFARVRDSLDAQLPVGLLVVSGPIVAEALTDHIIAANEALADLPEGERAFVLAHELGHLVQSHWSKRALLFREHLPGAAVTAPTELAGDRLATQASALAHRQELDADAFALRTVRQLGYGFETALAVFMRQEAQRDTASHPSSRKRVAHLRSLAP